MSRRRNLTVQEALEYLKQISENDSEGDDNNENISTMSSGDEYLPANEDILDSDEKNESENYASNALTVAGPSHRNSDDDSSDKIEKSNILRKDTHAKRKLKKKSAITFKSGNKEIGKDGTVWNVAQLGTNNRGRKSKCNILKEVGGPTPHAKRNVIDNSPSSAWRLFIDEWILKHIKKCTEDEAHRQIHDTEWNITLEEIDAFISILYARGIYCAKGLEVDSLWSKDWGPPFFKDTMSRDQFREIMRFLRFDIKSTRSKRLETDKFALISDIWYRFIENCKTNYTPGPNITVDEQLFPTKARCRFTQYMPSKPDKFGIKFWLAADVDTKYLINGFPYLGKDSQSQSNISLSEHVVLRLISPYENKGRNVTTDNFFTTLKLAQTLKAKNTSLVGTVKRSRREIPLSVKMSKSTLHSTTVLTHKDISLTVYQGKKEKNVLLLSTLHPTVEITDNPKKLPDTIAFYNATKYGVDVIDQMARKYSVKSASRRWPVQVFYNILDLAAINAWVLYKAVTGKSISRRQFIQDLVEELREKFVLPRQQKVSKRECEAINENDGQPQIKRKRVRCHSSKCENKTIDICSNCKTPICGKCVKLITKFCAQCSTL